MSKKTVIKNSSKKLRTTIAATGVLLGASVASLPFLFKIATGSEVQVENFESFNVSRHSAEFNFDLKSNQAGLISKLKKNVDQSFVMLFLDSNNVIREQKAVKWLEHKQKFSVETNNLDAGSLYTIRLLNLSDRKSDLVNFVFSQNANYIVTKPEISFSLFSTHLSSSTVKLGFSDQQDILKDKEIRVEYKQKSDEAKSSTKLTQVLTTTDNRKNNHFVEFSLDNLKRASDYEILGVYFKDKALENIPSNWEKIDFSSKASNLFSTSAPFATLSQIEQTAMTSTTADISLIFETVDPTINAKEVIVEYYWQNEDGSYAFRAIPNLTIEKKADNSKNVYEIKNIHITDLNEGGKFGISRIYTKDNKEVNVRLDNDKVFNFYTQAVVKSIRNEEAETSANLTVEFVDKQESLNNKKAKIFYKEVKEDGTVDGQPELVVEGQLVGSILRVQPKNLKKLQKYQIEKIEVEDFLNVSTKKPQLQVLDFASSFDDKEKTFKTNVKSAEIQKITFSDNTETAIKTKLEFKADDKFLEYYQAQLQYAVVAAQDVKDETNFLTSDTYQDFKKEADGKFTIDFSLDKLQSGNAFIIKGLKLVPKQNLNKKNLSLNNLETTFNPLMDGTSLLFYTLPVISDIIFTQNKTSANLNIVFDNAYPEDAPNSFFTKDKNKKIRAKVYYKLYGGNNNATNNAADTQEHSVDATIFQNGINNLEIKNLTGARIYQITKVEVLDNYTSSKKDKDILAVSTALDNDKKFFSTVAETISVTKIENIHRDQDNSTITVSLSKNATDILKNKTVILRYNKLGSNETKEVETKLKQPITNPDTPQLEFKATNLELGTKYIINSIKLKSDLAPNQTNTNKDSALLTQILFDKNIKTTDKAFFTSSGILDISYKNDIERTIGVVIQLADALGEYKDKYAVLNYKLMEQTGVILNQPQQEQRSLVAPIINNRVVFNLTDLVKKGKYQLIENQGLEIVDNPRQTQVTTLADANNHKYVPFKKDLVTTDQEKQKSQYFNTIPKTANIDSITNESTTKNSATFKVKLNALDSYLNGQKITVSYRKLGSASTLLIQTTTLQAVSNDEATFNLQNLDDGSKYNIVSFEKATKDSEPIIFYTNSVDNDHKILTTKATLKDVQVDTSKEATAKITLRFNDSAQEIIGKKAIKVTITNQQNTNLTKELTVEDNLPFYTFRFDNLSKTDQYKITKIEVADKKQPTSFADILRPTKQDQEKEIINNSTFRVTASKAVVEKVEFLDTQTNSTKVKLTFDKDSQFIQGQKVKITYTNLSDAQNKKEIIANPVEVQQNSDVKKVVEFDLDQLKSGDKYQILNVELVDDPQKPIDGKNNDFSIVFSTAVDSQANLEKRFFVPTPSIETINWEQPTETGFKINFKLYDNSGSFNNRKARITYKDKDNPGAQIQTTGTNLVAVQNSNFSINLDGLTKAKNYKIEKIEISNDSQGTQFTELAGFTALDIAKKEQYLNPWTTEVSSIDTTTAFVQNSEKNSATIKLNFKATDTFLVGRKLKITLKANAKDAIDTIVEATVISSNGTAAIDDHSLQNLEPATIYKIVKIEDVSNAQEAKNHPKLKNIFFASNITDEQRLLVTKPVVTGIKIVNNGETARTIYISLKDPLKNFSSDARSFEGKKLRITYERKSNLGTSIESQEVNIVNSNAKLELSNLTKDETYVIKSVEWTDATPTTHRTRRTTATFTSFYLWKLGQNGQPGSAITEQERTFHVMPTTATTSSLSFASVTNNSAKVLVSFDQADSFLNTNNTYSQHLQLRYLASGSGQIQSANLVYQQQSKKFEADLSNLPYGSNIIVTGISYTKQTNTSDLKISFDDTSQKNKIFGTLPAVSRIENKSDPNSETNWNIDVFFKDTPRKLEGHKVVLKYQKVNISNQQEQIQGQELHSSEFEVKNSRVEISLSNLDKYQNYKILGLYWKQSDKNNATINDDSIFIPTSDLVKNFEKKHQNLDQELQKTNQSALLQSEKTGQIFKTIPKTQSITNIEYKSITSNSANLEVSFNIADNNYLDQYTKVELKYRNVNKTSSALTTITATATKDNQTNTYKAKFNLLNLEVGQYEITSIEYQQGQKVNRIRYTQTQTFQQEQVNADNPENVRIEFGPSVLPTQKIFTTLTSIKQILIPSNEVGDTSARVEVELNDTSGIFNGSILSLKVHKKNEPNQMLQSQDALVISSSSSSSSRAIFSLDNLDKNTQYQVAEVRLKQNQKDLKLEKETQTSSNYHNLFQQEFTTSAKHATITKIIDESNQLQNQEKISKAKVKLEFDAKDKFLKDKNIQLYLKYTAILEGNSYYSTQSHTVTQDGSKYTVEYSLDDLSAGSPYKIDGLFMTNQEQENAKGLTSSQISTLIDIDPSQQNNQIFKTEVAISKIQTSTSETAANVLVTLANSQNKEFTNTATIVYKKEGQTQTTQVTNVIKQSNSQFLFSLTNLDKVQKYEIQEIKLETQGSNQQVAYNFDTNFNADQKKFETDIDNVNIAVSANMQNQDTTGNFILQVNENEKNIFNKYEVFINYQAVDKSEAQQQISWTNLTQNNQQFQVSNLSNGQQYQITNIQLKLKDSLRNTDSKLLQVIPVTITNPEPTIQNTILTNTSIKSISSVSTVEKQANITIELNNNNQLIKNSQFMKLTYQLIKEGTTVSGAPELHTNSNFIASDNKVVFNLDQLQKGSQYKIIKLEYTFNSQTSAIKFATNITEDEKKFNVLATTADIINLHYEQITSTSAKVKVTLKEDNKFLLTNDDDISLVYKNANDNIIFTTQPSRLTNKNSQLEIEYDLRDLQPGTKYEIDKIISLKNSISVSQDPTIQNTYNINTANRKEFYTNVEVSDIQLAQIANPNDNNNMVTRALDHTANIKVVFADREKTLVSNNNTNNVKLTIKQGSTIGLNNAPQSTTKEVEAQVKFDNTHSQVYAEFNLTSLVKWTNYSVESVTLLNPAQNVQSTTNPVINFDAEFNQGREKASKKHFQTSGDVVDFEKNIQVVDIFNPRNTSVILEVNKLNAQIMKGHSYHLEFKDIETNKTYKSDEFATVRNDYQDSFGGTSLRGKNILKFNISKNYISATDQPNVKVDIQEGKKFQVTAITEVSQNRNTRKIAVGIPNANDAAVLNGTQTNTNIDGTNGNDNNKILFQTIYDYPTVENLSAGDTTYQNGKWKTTLKLKFNDPNDTLKSNKQFIGNTKDWFMEKAVIKVSFNNTNLYLNWTKDNTNSASQNGYDVKNPSFDQTPGQKILSFDLEASDIKNLINKDIKVSVVRASYLWVAANSFDDAVFSDAFTSRLKNGITKTVYGEEIKTQIKPKLYIEQATSTVNYDKDLFGFTIAVYDPTGLIKTTNDQENKWANDRLTLEKVNSQSFNLHFNPGDLKVSNSSYNRRLINATQENVWAGNKVIPRIFDEHADINAPNMIRMPKISINNPLTTSGSFKYVRTLSAADYKRQENPGDVNNKQVFGDNYAFVTFFYDLNSVNLNQYGSSIAELELSKIKILEDTHNSTTSNLTIYNPSGRKRWLIDPVTNLNEFIGPTNGNFNNLRKNSNPIDLIKANQSNSQSLSYSSNNTSSSNNVINQKLTSKLYIKRWTYSTASQINNVKVFLSRPNNFSAPSGWNNWAALAVFMDESGNLYFAGDDSDFPSNLFRAGIFTNQNEVILNFSLKVNTFSNKKLTFLGVWVKRTDGTGWGANYTPSQFLIDPTKIYTIHRTIQIN